MSFTEDIEKVIELMVAGFNEEIIMENQEAFLTLQKMYREDSKHFLEIVQFAQNDFNTLVQAAMGLQDFNHHKNSYIFEHVISGLYKDFHTRRIEKLEGISCSVDKSSYIESMTMKAVVLQKNYSLYDNYMKVDQIKEDKDKQAYWSPTTVKDTDEAIALFQEWYELDHIHQANHKEIAGI